MIKFFSIFLALVMFLSVSALAEAGKKQTKCPICKMKVKTKDNKDIYVDYKGKRIYLGCDRCPPVFRKNPEKYIKKMEAKGIELEKAPEQQQ